MTEQAKCPRCGASLTEAEAASQSCPRCLLRVGLDASAATGGVRRGPAPSLAELQPHFPRLELLALVGEGGMGAVYKSRDKELDRLVALKVLMLDGDDSAPFDERFAREARAMARLSHPNIAAVFDHGRAGPWSFLVMEYVDGENLRRALRSRAIEPEQSLRWVGEICSALQYAHENGVVHRDIKPENVLVDSKGRVKVVDFGLAKLLDRRPGEATLTQTRQSLGTWHYMAPEQYERPQSVDHRADIYSLGVVFYELLTGQVPVGRFDPPSQRIAVDVRVDEVVLKALAREPEKRWQAAQDVKTQVDDIGRGAPVTAKPQRSKSSVMRFWPAALIALGVLGALAIALMFALVLWGVSAGADRSALAAPGDAPNAAPSSTASGFALGRAWFIVAPSLAGALASLAAAWWIKRRSAARWPAFALLAAAVLLFLTGVGALVLRVWSDDPPARSAPFEPVTPIAPR